MARPYRPPVPFDWSASSLKILGIFIGPGNLDDENWRPRINAVYRALQSWRSRSLFFTGKALLVNALALSQVCYVASLVHMPSWVGKERSLLIFSFFWSGKLELVARSSVSQPPLLGGFSVVDIKYKVWALLVQWVRRFASSPPGWCSILSFWFLSSFGVPPLVVFSRPFFFDHRALPPVPSPGVARAERLLCPVQEFSGCWVFSHLCSSCRDIY